MRGWVAFALVVLFVPLLASANPPSVSGEVPFPWGNEIPFPWSDIDGVWEAEFADSASHFSFRVVSRPGDESAVLEVFEVDPSTRSVLARGYGVAAWTEKIIDAIIHRGSIGHRLLIRGYKKKVNGLEKTIMVMTDRVLDGPPVERDAVLSRLSPIPVTEKD